MPRNMSFSKAEREKSLEIMQTLAQMLKLPFQRFVSTRKKKMVVVFLSTVLK